VRPHRRCFRSSGHGRSHRRLLLPLVALVSLAGAALVAAGSTGLAATRAGSGHAQRSAQAPAEATVNLVGLHALPDHLQITTGTTVVWINSELYDYPLIGGAHEIVGDDGSFSSPVLAPGTRWAHRFTRPGTFTFHCHHHTSLVGTIVVTGPAVEEPLQQEVDITEPNPDDSTSWGFRPADVVIDVGSTVVWRNNGKMAHTVTANDKSFDSGNIAPGATWTHRFDTPGVVAYHCTPHPWMKALVRVAVPGGPAPPAPAEGPTIRSSHAAAAVPATARGHGRAEIAVTEGDASDPMSWGFRPADLVVDAGTTVVWRNTGSMTHTITANDGTFDSGPLAPGATWTHSFDRPGVVAYHCTPHPWMKGVVRVAQAGLAPPAAPVEGVVTPPTGAASGPQPQRQGHAPLRLQARIIEGDLSTPSSWGFSPAVIDAQVGDTVAWLNTGTMAHSVTSDANAFDSGMIAPGATWEHRFTTPGTFAYHCTPHPWMKAVVNVTGAPGAGASAGASAVPPASGSALRVPASAAVINLLMLVAAAMLVLFIVFGGATAAFLVAYYEG
jgi:plastocyanin